MSDRMTKSEIANSLKLLNIELFKILVELCQDIGVEQVGIHIDNVRQEIFKLIEEIEK